MAKALAISRKGETVAVPGPGRPRSDQAHQAVLKAMRELLVKHTFDEVPIERIAERAGVGKATIYRHWPTRDALLQELLRDLAGPHIVIPDKGNTREEMRAAVLNPIRALTKTDFGPVLRAVLSQVAGNPQLARDFRATVVRARRNTIAEVIKRGVLRGDLRADADADVATELLAGPVYFRFIFGGELDRDFADRVVDAVLDGFRQKKRGTRRTSSA